MFLHNNYHWKLNLYPWTLHLQSQWVLGPCVRNAFSPQAKNCFLRRAASRERRRPPSPTGRAGARTQTRLSVGLPEDHGPPGGHGSGEYPCEAGRCDSPVFWRNLFSDFPVNPVILSDIASKKLSNICLSFSHFFLHPAYSCGSSEDKWHLTSSLCVHVQCCKCQFMKGKREKGRKKEGGREGEGGKKEGKKEREREKQIGFF